MLAVHMAEAVLTLPRLFLGRALKRLREENGATLDRLAGGVGKSRTKLINVLEGKGTLTLDELTRLLDLLGATGKLREELLALGAEARKRPARRPNAYVDLLPPGYERLADMETMATEIWSYERGVIPGLLQIPQYVESLMTDQDGIWWEPSWQERRNRITFRLERRRLMMAADPAKSMHFIICDDALRTEVGGPETMRRQLEDLLRLIDEQPNITIQVIAATAPHNPAPSGGMIVLHFGEIVPPVGFLPTVYGPSSYFQEPTDTSRLARAFGKLQALSISPEESRRVIADLAARS